MANPPLNTVAQRAREFRKKRGHWGTHAEALCSEVERLHAQNQALRNLANNLRPGPISEALAGKMHEAPYRSAVETTALPARINALLTLLGERDSKHDAFRLAETACNDGRATSYGEEMSEFDNAHAAVQDWASDPDNLAALFELLRCTSSETTGHLTDDNRYFVGVGKGVDSQEVDGPSGPTT